MKKLVMFTIDFYQKFLDAVLKNIFGINPTCRFYPVCSIYAKESVEKYGILRGGKMFLVRFSKCQPFYKENLI